MKIRVIDRENEGHDIEWEESQSLMEALRDNDLPVLASCGGQRSCATCHVFLDEATMAKVGVAEGEELELLADTEAYRPECSRLSCQIPFSEEHSDIGVTIAPEDW